MKKGQIAFFLVIALILISVVILLFALRDEANINVNVQTKEEISATDLGRFIQSCVDSSLSTTVLNVASKGGVYNEDSPGMAYGFGWVPLYYDQGEVFTPTIERFETDLSFAFNQQLYACVDDFDAFSNDIAYEVPTSTIQVTEETVLAQVNFPVTISQQQSRTVQSEFTATQNVRLWDLYKTAEELTLLQTEDPDNVCVSCLSEVAHYKDVDISIEGFDQTSIMYKIRLYDEEQDRILTYPIIHKFAE